MDGKLISYFIVISLVTVGLATAALANVHTKANDLKRYVQNKAYDTKNTIEYETRRIKEQQERHFNALLGCLEELKESLDELTPEDNTDTMVSINEVIATLEKMREV